MSNKKILILGLILTLGFATFLFWPDISNEINLSDKKKIVMYKNAGCECCTKWAAYMMATGDYIVEEKPVEVLAQVKQDYGISRENSSCHTAIVDGYVIEGHVPAEDVNRLLSERPDAIGIAVPGMPIGSPGMEVPGRPAANYDVVLVGKDGSTSVYNSH